MAVHGNMAGAEQHPDIANQRLLTHKGKTLAALAFLFKHQSNRLDIYIQADGGLKQAGMKRLYIQPRRSRTFREQAHGITTLETHGHLLADDLNGTSLPTLDENRTGTRNQPANDRPAANIAFCYERSAAHAVKDKNVQPGNMVGHIQHRAILDGLAMLEHAHATDQHQEARHAQHHDAASAWTQYRKKQTDA